MTTSKGKGKAQPVTKEQDIFNRIMALKADVQAMYTLVDQLDKSIQESGVKLAEMLQERHKTLKAELSNMIDQGDVEPLSINHNASDQDPNQNQTSPSQLPSWGASDGFPDF
ncbi:hypothetical protein NW752_003652 [Fusarium irregulare]|uniref:Uncharacterized protein n=1 Tax=Fusarium irregulare TaxID=2494466 RepID=A0A9W8UBM4_9HYPO|nr:hypothetical protein NW766_004723 [Fusarium irregulare]KAJ4023191.1 hypothetical protein NW752_003652 [Fusarium irregulare]